MKIKNIPAVLFLAFVLVSCMPVAKVAPTETSMPTLVMTSTTIPTTTSAPTYAYLPTITLVPSSTPFIITPSVSQALTSHYSQVKYENAFIVTIKEESFFARDYHDPNYRVLLNFNNFSEKEIGNLTFYLVTYKSKDYKEIPDVYNYIDFVINVLGTNSDRYNIPVGESDFLVNISIDVLDGNYSQCTDGSLDKPLYLLLFFGSLAKGNTDNPLEVSNDLNQKILEIPCTWE